LEYQQLFFAYAVILLLNSKNGGARAYV
jgi:hypothetical protein